MEILVMFKLLFCIALCLVDLTLATFVVKYTYLSKVYFMLGICCKGQYLRFTVTPANIRGVSAIISE